MPGSWSSNQMMHFCVESLKNYSWFFKSQFYFFVLFFVVILVATVVLLLVLYCIASSLREHFLTSLPHFLSPWKLPNKNWEVTLAWNYLFFSVFFFLHSEVFKFRNIKYPCCLAWLLSLQTTVRRQCCMGHSTQPPPCLPASFTGTGYEAEVKSVQQGITVGLSNRLRYFFFPLWNAIVSNSFHLLFL